MIARALLLLILLGWALLPPVASAAGGRSYFELSAGGMSGDFGTPTTYRLYSLSPTLGYVAPAYDLSVTVPYLVLTSEIAGESQAERGIGDVLLRGGAVLLQETSFGLSLGGGAAVKLPTADENKGLGTGEADYAASASLQQRLREYRVTVLAGYLLTGDPAGIEYQDGLFYGVGLARSFTATTLYAALEGRRAALAGFDNPQEVSVGFFHLFNADYAVKGHVFVGLNDGGPDRGGSLGLVRWF